MTGQLILITWIGDLDLDLDLVLLPNTSMFCYTAEAASGSTNHAHLGLGRMNSRGICCTNYAALCSRQLQTQAAPAYCLLLSGYTCYSRFDALR